MEVPFSVMGIAYDALDLLEDMARQGNPNSISDVGVGTSCIHTAVYGAYLNVLINLKDLEDDRYAELRREEANALLQTLAERERVILDLVHETIAG